MKARKSSPLDKQALWALSFSLPYPEGEEASAWLLLAGALAVDLDVCRDEANPGITKEKLRIRALFPPEIHEGHLVSWLEKQLGPLDISWEKVDSLGWVEKVKESFRPLAIAPGFWVRPSWEKGEDKGVSITLDPGLAFGTGEHPSTRSILSWLWKQKPILGRVLDYGCGSGILGIAAKKLGASRVLATDTDSLALCATLDNAQKNRVDIKVFAPEDLPLGWADLLLANIYLAPLQELAPRFFELLAPQGQVVLAGFLEKDASLLARTFNRAGFVMAAPDAFEGWALLAGKKT